MRKETICSSLLKINTKESLKLNNLGTLSSKTRKKKKMQKENPQKFLHILD